MRLQGCASFSKYTVVTLNVTWRGEEKKAINVDIATRIRDWNRQELDCDGEAMQSDGTSVALMCWKMDMILDENVNQRNVCKSLVTMNWMETN